VHGMITKSIQPDQTEPSGSTREESRVTHEKGYRIAEPDDLHDLLPAERDSIILVDFDETLWLRNSTEEFLKSARPRFLACLILNALVLMRPWRLVPDRASRPHYKDWMRVLAITLCLPWSLVMWRRKAEELGPAQANWPLIEMLRKRNQAMVVVITLGFRPIVAPLLRSIAGADIRLIAPPLPTGMIWRVRGKRAAARARLTAAQLSGATVVTDNLADIDLLCAAGNGILCNWPGARYAPFGTRDDLSDR